MIYLILAIAAPPSNDKINTLLCFLFILYTTFLLSYPIIIDPYLKCLAAIAIYSIKCNSVDTLPTITLFGFYNVDTIYWSINLSLHLLVNL